MVFVVARLGRSALTALLPLRLVWVRFNSGAAHLKEYRLNTLPERFPCLATKLGTKPGEPFQVCGWAGGFRAEGTPQGPIGNAAAWNLSEIHRGGYRLPRGMLNDHAIQQSVPYILRKLTHQAATGCKISMLSDAFLLGHLHGRALHCA